MNSVDKNIVLLLTNFERRRNITKLLTTNTQVKIAQQITKKHIEMLARNKQFNSTLRQKSASNGKNYSKKAGEGDASSMDPLLDQIVKYQVRNTYL